MVGLKYKLGLIEQAKYHTQIKHIVFDSPAPCEGHTTHRKVNTQTILVSHRLVGRVVFRYSRRRFPRNEVEDWKGNLKLLKIYLEEDMLRVRCYVLRVRCYG